MLERDWGVVVMIVTSVAMYILWLADPMISDETETKLLWKNIVALPFWIGWWIWLFNLIISTR